VVRKEGGYSASLRNRLDAAFARGEELAKSGKNLETSADHTKFLCVLVSGYVETVIPEFADSFAKTRSSPEIQNYVSSHAKRLQNVNARKLREFLKAFNPLWETELSHFLGQSGREEALNSTVGFRNRIAHGENVGTLSLSSLILYYDKIKEIIDFVELKFKT
jgi:hypothetical protein